MSDRHANPHPPHPPPGAPVIRFDRVLIGSESFGIPYNAGRCLVNHNKLHTIVPWFI